MAALDLEQRIIAAIQKGDLPGMKSVGISLNDINKPLTLSNEVQIVNKSQKCPFKTIRGPTIVVLCILCEQNEILQFVLNTFHPSFIADVNGWTPLHFSACTGNYKCMETLLSFEYIQENIDMKVLSSSSTNPSFFTTALHIAVTNHRHAQALLLLSEFPDILYGKEGEKLTTPMKSKYQMSNASQQSANGNTALHIATKYNDLDMIHILLFNGSDKSIVNLRGQTASDLARSLDYQEALKIIESEEQEDLYSKYIHEEIMENQTKDQTQSEEKLTNKENEIEYASKSQIGELTQTIQNLTSIVQQLASRVQLLEEKGKPPKVQACCRCGGISTHNCTKCSEHFCDKCFNHDSHKCK